MTTIDDAKRAAGVEVARLVEDGMIVGLGTGSTAAPAIRELGRRVRDEGLHITGTPTSFASEILAREVGIPLCDLRSEEHTSELQSRGHLVCRLLLAKKK